MRWLAISKKASREMVRDKMALFFALLFPLLFVLMFGVAFGSFTEGHSTYEIGVINLDDGIQLNETYVNHGENVLEILDTMKYLDSDGGNTSISIFNVHSDLTQEEAQEMVEDQDLTGYVIIPQNFSAAVTAESIRYVNSVISLSVQDQIGDNPTPEEIQNLIVNITGASAGLANVIPDYDENATATVILQGDPGGADYFTFSEIANGVVNGYVGYMGDVFLSQVEPFLPFTLDPSLQESHVSVRDEALEVSEFTIFDRMFPGFIVFALLMSAMIVTINLAKEESRGTLTRLKITKMSSFDMLFGTTIPFTLLAVGQLFILVGVAIMIGFKYHPEANLGLAIVIALIGAIASVALGLILAALVKNEDQAGTVAPGLIVPLSFLTGAFFPMPGVTLSENFLGTGKSLELFDLMPWTQGKSLELFDLMPWTQCVTSLKKVLTFGADFNDVAMEIGLMIVFTIVLFAIGVFLYHKKRLRGN
jgi:ABC-2 type transport system permease protein